MGVLKSGDLPNLQKVETFGIEVGLMTRTKVLCGFCAVLFTCSLFAQNGEGQVLDTVVLVDRQIKRYSTGQKIQKLSDSLLKTTPGTLTDILEINTSLFFKQNGYGMVSSPTFRGTTAQQTAVVWNGFNINSQLTGQTDFNTLVVDGFDQLDVRAGGGSVIYGTGAIGGSIHLQNKTEFNRGVEAFASARYGSFDTFQNLIQTDYSNEKLSLSVALSRLSSENDYPILETDRRNSNAAFEHYNANLNAAYRLDDDNTLSYHGMYFNGNRNFALLFPTDTRTGYENDDHRHLIEWERRGDKLTSVLQGVYFREDYNYISNLENPNPVGSTVNTYKGRYSVFFNPGNWELSSVADYEHNTAQGNDLEAQNRNIASLAVLGKYKFHSLTTELSARQEVTDVYDVPLLFSAGLDYRLNNRINLLAKASRNYRMPTYNDLFWQGAGNPELDPENSYQAEGSVVFKSKNRKHQLSATGYYNDIQDLIRWIPDSNNVWRPENVDEVITYGGEFNYQGAFDIGNSSLDLSSGYAYTISENAQTGNFLTFVPRHKVTAQAAWHYQDLTISLQNLYLGEVFTRSNNDPDDVLEDYLISHLSAAYTFPKLQELTLNFQVRNLANVDYETTENRPMPGRHFFITSTIKF